MTGTEDGGRRTGDGGRGQKTETFNIEDTPSFSIYTFLQDSQKIIKNWKLRRQEMCQHSAGLPVRIFKNKSKSAGVLPGGNEKPKPAHAQECRE
jgi:hypothetical protein